MKKKFLIVSILFIIPVIFVLGKAVLAVMKLEKQNIQIYTAGSMGEPVALKIGPIEPALVVKSELASLHSVSQRIKNCKDPILLKPLETEVSKGDPIIECMNKIVESEYNGLVKELIREEDVIIIYDDYSQLKLELEVSPKEKQSYARDLENEVVKLKYVRQDMSLNKKGNLRTVYEVLSHEDVSYYVGEYVEFYFFANKTLENQIIVNKVALFYKEDKIYLRVLESDGTLVGDVEVEILAEGQGEYAIGFIDGKSYTHFDLEYGIFQNRMQTEKSNE